MPTQRFEKMTQKDLWAKVHGTRKKMLDLKAELRTYVDEIGRRDAEAAEASRAGRSQTIGE